MKIAALFVDEKGPYANRADVDAWGLSRDARLYQGDLPVVAHPPCQRWGRYWYGGPSCKERKIKGDDGGCFASALASVRRCGGVLEHPEASAAWAYFGLFAPPRGGGWIAAGDEIGWTCCVEQGHYGHRARKATWLYAVGVDLPSLKWGRSAAKIKLDEGFHSREETSLLTRPPKNMTYEQRQKRLALMERRFLLTGKEYCCPERMGKKERELTPQPFADLLIGIARSHYQRRAIT